MTAFAIYFILGIFSLGCMVNIMVKVCAGQLQPKVTLDPTQNLFLSFCVLGLSCLFPYLITHDYWAISSFAVWLFGISVFSNVAQFISSIVGRNQIKDRFEMALWCFLRQSVILIAYTTFAIMVIA